MTVLTLEQAKPKLQEAYRQRRLIPFLGAGFSAPLRLPLWDELMGWMGQDLDFDPTLFKLHGLPPQLAGFYALKKDGLDAVIATMRERFHAPAVDERRKTSPQHRALGRLALRRIYTTNFEHHIEEAMRDGGHKAEVLARLEDFMRPHDGDACQVVKFHGDLAAPETVVLTESQFFDRFRLEAAPDQVLRADLLGNVFLFLGYSFSDVNIRYIWYRMDRLRREGQPEDTHVAPEQRCYWATFGVGLVQPSLLEKWHIDVIALDPRDKSRSVAELLDALPGKGEP